VQLGMKGLQVHNRLLVAAPLPQQYILTEPDRRCATASDLQSKRWCIYSMQRCCVGLFLYEQHSPAAGCVLINVGSLQCYGCSPQSTALPCFSFARPGWQLQRFRHMLPIPVENVLSSTTELLSN
jgi:hypothetical protein